MEETTLMTDVDIYDQLCDSYRAIDEFRTRLLGFLPLVTAGGVFALLAKGVGLTADKRNLLEPVAIFSVLITIGLYIYELYGMTKCHCLTETGKYLERMAHIHGQFVTRPGQSGV
jgi:hypothetical protein